MPTNFAEAIDGSAMDPVRECQSEKKTKLQKKNTKMLPLPPCAAQSIANTVAAQNCASPTNDGRSAARNKESKGLRK